ncbi:hypothetical protein OFM52_29400, partial [Escherichia coli]|nr:hypothetical protein [Escherichia coli]
NNSNNIDNNDSNNSLRPISKISRFTNYKLIFFKALNVNKDKTKFKRNNISIFNPFINNLNNISIIKFNSDLIYTNTIIFKDRLIALLKNDPNRFIYK